MGACFGKQNKNQSKKSRNQSGDSKHPPVFDDSPKDKKLEPKGLPMVAPSSTDLHLLNTTTNNTLTPHVGPQIMITGATESLNFWWLGKNVKVAFR